MITELELKDKYNLTDRMARFVIRLCDPSSETRDNEKRSYMAVYTKSNEKAAEANSNRLIRTDKIKQAIQGYKAEIGKILTYDRQLHIKNLNALLTALQIKVNEGNVSAIRAANSILSEIGASTGLHSQTINTDAKELEELTKQEVQEAKRFASIRLREMA